MGELLAVIILEGDPDRGVVWLDEGDSESCEELLDAIPADHRTAGDEVFARVGDGDDIQTG